LVTEEGRRMVFSLFLLCFDLARLLLLNGLIRLFKALTSVSTA